MMAGKNETPRIAKNEIVQHSKSNGKLMNLSNAKHIRMYIQLIVEDKGNFLNTLNQTSITFMYFQMLVANFKSMEFRYNKTNFPFLKLNFSSFLKTKHHFISCVPSTKAHHHKVNKQAPKQKSHMKITLKNVKK